MRWTRECPVPRSSSVANSRAYEKDMSTFTLPFTYCTRSVSLMNAISNTFWGFCTSRRKVLLISSFVRQRRTSALLQKPPQMNNRLSPVTRHQRINDSLMSRAKFLSQDIARSSALKFSVVQKSSRTKGGIFTSLWTSLQQILLRIIVYSNSSNVYHLNHYQVFAFLRVQWLAAPYVSGVNVRAHISTFPMKMSSKKHVCIVLTPIHA